ncbi:MAG: DUF1896 family protein [Muribaculaceae bacterium]|nr:DUF1896 family protein [Muribaculaceae bacterium]
MKEKHNYTIRYDLDYFMTRLLGYLIANKYIIDPETHQVIQNVTDAEDIFFEERRYGKTVTEALEIADEILFRNVGLSQYDVVTDLLMDNYSDTFGLDSEKAMEYWTVRVLTEIPDLFDDFDNTIIGIDQLELDTNYDALVGRIVIFMSDNGVQ